MMPSMEIWYMTLVFPECAMLAAFKVDDVQILNLEVYDMAKPKESLIIRKRAGGSAPQFA